MNNDSVRGYVIITLKNLGYTLEQIEQVLDELHYTFDITSEHEAEQYYYNGKWKKETK